MILGRADQPRFAPRFVAGAAQEKPPVTVIRADRTQHRSKRHQLLLGLIADTIYVSAPRRQEGSLTA
jgi:hypothetical protein